MAGFIHKKQCITLLQDLGRELGRPVRCRDVENRTVLYRSILHHFGSFNAARRTAGLLGPEPKRRWSREAMLEELRRLYDEGIRITDWDLSHHGRYDLIGAARAYYGGVARARSLAGIPIPMRLETDSEPWDQERIVEEILSLHGSGESLASTRVSRKLTMAARYHFGSYRAAIEAAGLDYDTIRLVREPYTREDVLQEIRGLAESRPEMTISELHAHGMADACRHEFGSLEAAVLAAGLTHWPLRLNSPLLTETETREALRARIREGRPVSVSVLQREDLHLLRSAMRHFGGLTEGEAREDLLEEPKGRPPWTKEEIFEGLRARQREGLPINGTDLQREDPRLLRAAIRQFGSLRKATTSAGVVYKPLQKSRWTMEELSEALHARWRAGLPLNPQALHLEEPRLYRALNRRYGDFSRPEVALELGLPADAMAPLITRWSPERVIAELQALAAGGQPIEWKQVQPILKTMCLKYFGSMAGARAAAGVPEPRRSWSREKVIDLLRAQSPDEPYPRDLVSAAQTHFGTWLAALDAAGVAPRPRRRRRKRK